MIQYIAYNNLDYEKWDKCIIGSVNGSVYAKSWYLDIVCEQWDALVLNDYEAVMPLPKKVGYNIYISAIYVSAAGLFHKR